MKVNNRPDNTPRRTEPSQAGGGEAKKETLGNAIDLKEYRDQFLSIAGVGVLGAATTTKLN